MNRDERIRQNFRSPGHPTAFSAPGNIAKHYGISQKKAKEILQQVDSYVLHKEYKRPKYFNPYYVYNRRELIQSDLIDIRALQANNDGVNYLLLFIDVFSRKVHVYPLKRKTAGEMIAALTTYLQDLGNPIPNTLMTDAGQEFWARSVQIFLRKKGISQQLAHGTSKASYAERANKTIQILIYKFLSDRETTRYIDELQNLVKTYNKRGHRNLNYLTPDEADKPENSQRVRAIATSRFAKIKRKKPSLELGDVVRIKTDPQNVDPNRRAYAEQYQGEFFIIIRINKILPIPMYYLVSMNNNELIKDGFYSNELSKIQGDVFKIDEVLQERGRGNNKEVLVRWKFFDDRHNSWIPARNVIENFRR